MTTRIAGSRRLAYALGDLIFAIKIAGGLVAAGALASTIVDLDGRAPSV